MLHNWILPEPTLTFKPKSKITNIKNGVNITKVVLELLSTLGTIGNLLPGTGMPVKAGITAYKEGLKLAYLYLGNKDRITENLINGRIEKSIAKNTGDLIKAELIAIENRIKRIDKIDISNTKKYVEAICALHSCEKIIALFDDENNCLWKSALPSSQTLVGFIPIYVDVLKKTSELSPSYKPSLEEGLKISKNILKKYKKECVNIRMNEILLIQSECDCDTMTRLFIPLCVKKRIAEDFTLKKVMYYRDNKNDYYNGCFSYQPLDVSRKRFNWKIVDNWDSWEIKSIEFMHSSIEQTKCHIIINNFIKYSANLKNLYEKHFDQVIEKLDKIEI